MSFTDNTCGCTMAEEKHSSSSNLSGIKLFKSIVRRVRHKITESNIVKSPSGSELPTTMSRAERSSVDENTSGSSVRSQSPSEIRRLFGNMQIADDKSRTNGYSSDSGTDKPRRSSRVRIRQKVRSRSKSDGRRIEKKPKKILRPPPTYVYVRGMSGIPTQRIRVR